MRASQGWDRKRQNWVEYLREIISFEFEQLSSSDVKLSRSLMKSVALALLEEEGAPYISSDTNTTTIRQITENVIMSWIDFLLIDFTYSYVYNLGLYLDHHRKHHSLKEKFLSSRMFTAPF